MISFKTDRENCWIKIAESMKEVVASGNIQRLLVLIRRTSASEVVCDRNGVLIHGKWQSLDGWGEHIKAARHCVWSNVLSCEAFEDSP